MAVAAVAAGIFALASGTLVEVDERGKAAFVGCDWAVQVASGCPEPDFPSDAWKIVDCGTRVRVAADGETTCCEAGHARLPLEVAWSAGREFAERAAFSALWA